jgi:hypothetical protein
LKTLCGSCAFSNEKRKRCAFQPTLMRPSPLGAGLPAEEFAALPPEPASLLAGRVRLCTRKTHTEGSIR